MHSVLGTIMDPAADKILMTTLTVTLSMGGYIPGVYSLTLALRENLIVSSATCRDHHRTRCPLVYLRIRNSV